MSTSLFWVNLLQRVLFSLKYTHWRSSTVQEEGLTSEGRHHLLLLCKQALDKRAFAESLQECIATNYVCGWCIFERNITALGNMPTPLFEEPFKFIAIFSRDYSKCDSLWCLCRRSRGKKPQTFSLHFCILQQQVIKNWSWGRPGNKATCTLH